MQDQTRVLMWSARRFRCAGPGDRCEGWLRVGQDGEFLQ